MVKKTKFTVSKFQVQPVHSSDVSRQGRQTFRHVALGFHCATQSMYPICLHPRQPIFWLCAYRGLFAWLRRFPNTACSKTSRDTPWGVRKTIINTISMPKDRIWQVPLPASYENTIVCSGWNIDIQSAFRRHGENAQPKCSTWAHCCNSSAAHPLVGLLVDAYTSAKVGVLEVAILPVVSVGVWNDIVWCNLLQSCGHALLTSPFILSHLATCGRSWEKSCRHLASPLEQKPPRKLQRKSPPRKF